MYGYRIGIQRTLRSCPCLLYMYDDVILRTVGRRCLGVILLILERIVENCPPGRITVLYFLMGCGIETVPVGLVFRLPVGIFLYGVLVLGTGGEAAGSEQNAAETEDTGCPAEKGRSIDLSTCQLVHSISSMSIFFSREVIETRSSIMPRSFSTGTRSCFMESR